LNGFGTGNSVVPHVIKLARNFEYFLEQRRKFNELKSWFDLITTQSTKLMICDVEYLRTHPRIQIPHEIRQLIKLSQIDTEMLGKHRRKLLELSEGWDKIVFRYQDGRDLKELLANRRSAKDLIWEGIRMIRCLVNAELPRMFNVLLSAMMQFQEIAQELDLGRNLLCNIIGQFPGDTILVPFVIFNGTVAREPGFMSEREKLAWVTFESCMREMLKDNPILMCQIVSAAEELSFQHCRKGKSS
jgi:hypothetical protein